VERSRRRSTTCIRKQFESVWDMVFQDEDAVFGENDGGHGRVSEDFALWCTEPPEDWEALLEACQELDENDAALDVKGEGDSNFPSANGSRIQITTITNNQAAEEGVAMTTDSIWDIGEEIESKDPKSSESLYRKEGIHSGETDLPENWEDLCSESEEVEDRILPDEKTDQKLYSSEQSKPIQVPVEQKCSSLPSNSGGYSVQHSGLPEISEAQKNKLNLSTENAQSVHVLKDKKFSGNLTSPKVKKPVTNKGTLQTPEEINFDSVWEMYDKGAENKAGVSIMPTKPAIVELHSIDAPENWEALVEESDGEDDVQLDKVDSLDMNHVDEPTAKKVTYGGTTTIGKSSLSPARKPKHIVPVKPAQRRQDSMSMTQKLSVEQVSTVKPLAKKQYDSVWDIPLAQQQSHVDKFSTTEESPGTSNADSNDGVSTSKASCFLLQSPEPTEDWEAFYSETHEVISPCC